MSHHITPFLFMVCIAKVLDHLYRTFDELCQRLALQQTVAEQCQVGELVHQLFLLVGILFFQYLFDKRVVTTRL